MKVCALCCSKQCWDFASWDWSEVCQTITPMEVLRSKFHGLRKKLHVGYINYVHKSQCNLNVWSIWWGSYTGVQDNEATIIGESKNTKTMDLSNCEKVEMHGHGFYLIL